ncbi:hypothetical protein GUITHDRAFT_162706 [Guillardia theta CCMP2712]|uniref:Uncharacterized protein n=1 Tax=Guillardia theta (strain CCMP2712) TaxID=905079 RepID=L1JFV4_GUITC|nr:hypothetical protein GUITHDRAFT_162706 [Guillardia theta CCMP2712]EKX47366.1 hypothetical protein GUITHDRAFT_162706 [Guillardia theta CCMP2712]|eukprot:XP_005834346.1 hypothetical protein GUITHDRAFT_162706 [Guillardia theta CCMP2712]
MQAFINSVVDSAKVDARKIDKCIDLLPKQFQTILISSNFSYGKKSHIPRYEATQYDDAYKVDDAVDEDEEFENRAAGQIKFWAAPDEDHECSNSHQDPFAGDDSNGQMSEDEAFVNGGDEPEPTQVPEICSESPSFAVEGERSSLKRKVPHPSESSKRQQVTNIPFSSYECRRYLETDEHQAQDTPEAVTCSWAKGFAMGWSMAATLSVAQSLLRDATAQHMRSEPETDPECGIFVGWQNKAWDQEPVANPSPSSNAHDSLRKRRETRSSKSTPTKTSTSQETSAETRESPATRILDLVKQAEEKFEKQYGKGSWSRKPTGSDEDSDMEDEEDDLIV